MEANNIVVAVVADADGGTLWSASVHVARMEADGQRASSVYVCECCSFFRWSQNAHSLALKLVPAVKAALLLLRARSYVSSVWASANAINGTFYTRNAGERSFYRTLTI